jgi:hypothetical protein
VAAINSANLGSSAQLLNTGNIATHYGMMVTYTNKWHPPSVVWDSTLRKSKASYSMRKFDVETKRLRVISINTLK